jgi:NADH:ubiquinone oxidoreductase subunit 6 (subunit J)
MIIRGMNVPLIIACIVIVLALIIVPLIVSYKAEKKEKNNKNEWDKIKEYGNRLYKKLEKNINRNNEKIIIVSINYSFF